MKLSYTSDQISASSLRDEQHSPLFARITIWTLVVSLFGFVSWASVTPVYEVVTGSGQIRPQSLVQWADHLEGGIVAQIHVREGDMVDRDTVLVSLDRNVILSELRKVGAEVDALSEQFARAQALYAGTPLADEAGAEAYLAEGGFRLSQIDVLRAEREILQAELTALGIRKENLRDDIAILDQRQERLEKLDNEQLVNRNELENASRDLVHQQSQLAQLEGEELVHAASIRRSHAREAELQAGFRRDTALMLEDLRTRLVAAKLTSSQLEDRLERADIRAPIAGVVQAMAVTNAGQVLDPGTAVAEIVPADTAVFAEIDVSADRISGIAPGKPASLKILTHDFTRFGDIDAQVDRVSPTSITKEDGRSVFRVRLSFDENAMGSQRSIGTGMTVTADIRTDRRTVLAYLMKPLRVIADRALSES